MESTTGLINHLKEKKYSIKVHHHAPLHTVEDSKKLRGEIEGAHTKNLFLKNKKQNFFLLSCEEEERVDLKKISKSLNLGNISFAKDEYLMEHLGVSPGSVSPFALINDKKNIVGFYLEEALYKSNFINFHPMTNTQTITILTSQFIEFMIEINKKIHIFSSTEGNILKSYG